MLEGPTKIPLYQVICKHLLSTYQLLCKQKETKPVPLRSPAPLGDVSTQTREEDLQGQMLYLRSVPGACF